MGDENWDANTLHVHPQEGGSASTMGRAPGPPPLTRGDEDTGDNVAPRSLGTT